MKRNELEERLIDFAVLIIELTNSLPKDFLGNHLSSQITRSATSSALNYGEAQSGESRKDFIHKIQIVLKELRETSICLKIIQRTHICKSADKLENLIRENNELISIFVKSVETAKRNT
jgi:four helix bundle protein